MFVQSEPANGVSGSRLQIFLLSVALITQEFEKSVNAFLEFRQYKILKDNGRISHKQATDKANAEYEIFNKTQPIESDFDKAVKKMIQEQN